MNRDFKKHYQLFLQANPGVQHYASHSHHYWPDVTRQAMIQYWDDSARLTDDKWSYFFGEKIPSVQKLIAQNLKYPYPEQIAFAPNTHEFVTRLLSCFSPRKKIKVLTSDSEFYSFERQINRLAQDDLIEVCKVPIEPFATFEERFVNESRKFVYDFIFVSHVFFNSGYALQDLNSFVTRLGPSTMTVIDGYHGFMALPTDLSLLADRVFYIAGSYKYAQGGEGCCFMSVPRDNPFQPWNTGWFAGFGQLSGLQKDLFYSRSGFQFAGSTMDYSALYRLEAVLKLFKDQMITVSEIHQYVKKLQKNFIQVLSELNHTELKTAAIINFENRLNMPTVGHFYTFQMKSTSHCQFWFEVLKKNKIHTDFRGDRLRFGFGLYQEPFINLQSLRL